MCDFAGSGQGRVAVRTDQFIRALEAGQSAREVIHARLRAGEEIPGFGHPLYPGGDPRAKLIMQLLSEEFPAEFSKIQKRIEDSERVLGKSANVDLALAAVARVLALPVDSGYHLFALGRTVGWIAHAAEQHKSGAFIRPRARYVGVMPLACIPPKSLRIWERCMPPSPFFRPSSDFNP